MGNQLIDKGAEFAVAELEHALWLEGVAGRIGPFEETREFTVRHVGVAQSQQADDVYILTVRLEKKGK